MTAPRERAESDVATRGGARGQTRAYTPLQMLFLNRLERLVEMKYTARSQVNGEKWLSDAISRAIYSALRDALEQGVGEEARAILRREHQAN